MGLIDQLREQMKRKEDNLTNEALRKSLESVQANYGGPSSYPGEFSMTSQLDAARSAMDLDKRRGRFETSRRLDAARDRIRANRTGGAGGSSSTNEAGGSSPTNIVSQLMGAHNSGQAGLNTARDRIIARRNTPGPGAPAGLDWGALANAGIAGGAAGPIADQINGENDQLSSLEQQIKDLLSQPDTPGQWISPYSQEYLNGLGDRLAESGSAAQQQYEAAKADILANYAQTQGTRDGANNALGGELGAGLSNLGLNYDTSAQGKLAAESAANLTQVAGVNQASDLSFNDKLGQLSAQLGQNLGMQAREGLLTPKQWVGPESGVSAGEAGMVDFLTMQYKDLLDRQTADREARLAGSTAGLGNMELTQTADEDYLQQYPEVVAAMGGIQDPKLRDELDRVWALTGDPVEALKYVTENYSNDDPEKDDVGGPPMWSYPTGVDAGTAKRLQNEYQSEVRKYQEQLAREQEDQAMYAAMSDFFKRLSPTYTGALTSRTMGNTSRATSP